MHPNAGTRNALAGSRLRSASDAHRGHARLNCWVAGCYLLEPEGMVWRDGQLALAVRHGAICYLDEIVEARQDTIGQFGA